MNTLAVFAVLFCTVTLIVCIVILRISYRIDRDARQREDAALPQDFYHGARDYDA